MEPKLTEEVKIEGEPMSKKSEELKDEIIEIDQNSEEKALSVAQPPAFMTTLAVVAYVLLFSCKFLPFI